MTRPTIPRMPPIISAGPLQRIRFEVFMTCQVSRLLWNAGDALEACPRDDAEDQVGNRLRPLPLSPRLVHPTGGSNPVDGEQSESWPLTVRPYNDDRRYTDRHRC